MPNAISVIHPYWSDGMLVFDDPAKGLEQEPFVEGADTVLSDIASRRLGEDPDKFTVLFSGQKFRGSTDHAVWVRAEDNGNVYRHTGLLGSEFEFWLCPALLKYFDEPPQELHIKIKEYNGCQGSHH